MSVRFRSSLASINLACLCYNCDVKTYGYSKILDALLSDIEHLEQDGLCAKKLNKVKKTLGEGNYFVVPADNLGAHSLTMFQQSFFVFWSFLSCML